MLPLYLLCHGGGEEHRLPSPRAEPDDLLHLVGKVLVQHAVCLIQNQHLHARQVKVWSVVQMVDESSRRGDDDIRAEAEISFLGLHIQTTWKRRRKL